MAEALVKRIDRLERLVAHRELELLRESTRRTVGGRRRVIMRGEKLREAQQALERARKALEKA